MPTYQFDCELQDDRALVGNRLVFDWDCDDGTVSGPGAPEILARAAAGYTPLHPLPTVWVFSAQPLKSFSDMAAIVGLFWKLPPELVEHYPSYRKRCIFANSWSHDDLPRALTAESAPASRNGPRSPTPG